MHIARSAVALAAALTLAAPALADITFQGGITVDVAIDLTPLIATGNWSASLSSSTPTTNIYQYGDFAQSAITSTTALGVANTSTSAYGFSNAVGLAGYTRVSSTPNAIIGTAYVDQTYTLALDPLGQGNTVPYVILPVTITWADDFAFSSSDAAHDDFGYYSRSFTVREVPVDQVGNGVFWDASSFAFDPLLGANQGSSSSGVVSGVIVLTAGRTVTLSAQGMTSLRADVRSVPSPWVAPVAAACLFTRRRRVG